MERVLIVDKTFSLLTARMSVVDGIRELGLNARGASTAQAALRLMEGEQYVLAIIELELPEMDGFELIRRMRTFPAARKIPIILLAHEHRWKGESIPKIVERYSDVYFFSQQVQENVLTERISRLLGDFATHSPD